MSAKRASAAAAAWAQEMERAAQKAATRAQLAVRAAIRKRRGKGPASRSTRKEDDPDSGSGSTGADTAEEQPERGAGEGGGSSEANGGRGTPRRVVGDGHGGWALRSAREEQQLGWTERAKVGLIRVEGVVRIRFTVGERLAILMPDGSMRAAANAAEERASDELPQEVCTQCWRAGALMVLFISLTASIRSVD